MQAPSFRKFSCLPTQYPACFSGFGFATRLGSSSGWKIPSLSHLSCRPRQYPACFSGFGFATQTHPLLEPLLVPPEAVPGQLSGFWICDSSRLGLRVWGFSGVRGQVQYPHPVTCRISGFGPLELGVRFRVSGFGCRGYRDTLSSEHGRYKTVKAGLWPWMSGKIRAFLPALKQDRYVTRYTTMVISFEDKCCSFTYHKICVSSALGLRDIELSGIHVYEECPCKTFGNLCNVCNVLKSRSPQILKRSSEMFYSGIVHQDPAHRRGPRRAAPHREPRRAGIGGRSPILPIYLQYTFVNCLCLF